MKNRLPFSLSEMYQSFAALWVFINIYSSSRLQLHGFTMRAVILGADNYCILR